MRIEHIVDDKTKRKLGYSDKGKGKVHSDGKKRNKSKSERLSERDLADLMDTNKRGFKRVRGAWRSK